MGAVARRGLLRSRRDRQQDSLEPAGTRRSGHSGRRRVRRRHRQRADGRGTGPPPFARRSLRRRPSHTGSFPSAVPQRHRGSRWNPTPRVSWLSSSRLHVQHGIKVSKSSHGWPSDLLRAQMFAGGRAGVVWDRTLELRPGVFDLKQVAGISWTTSLGHSAALCTLFAPYWTVAVSMCPRKALILLVGRAGIEPATP